MDDMDGNELRVFDTVRVNTLETTVDGFEQRFGREFIVTEYGEFAASVVKLVSHDPQKEKADELYLDYIGDHRRLMEE